RARAANFPVDRIGDFLAMLHQRGVKGYVTLNTLVFSDELPAVADLLPRLSDAGVDAVLVQDLGVARLAHRMCPDLPLHASTQMTMTSAQTIAEMQSLGIQRVVVSRESSLDDIRRICQETSMPVEAFVHGALCVAYSGQCLTSESLGGRSANRGQCAQACRLPYDLICDDEVRSLHDDANNPVRFLLSPQDLAAIDLIPQLIDIGVCSLKIEGRLKTPQYVANITSHYRQMIDRCIAGRAEPVSQSARREMELSFSRGFSPGWLEGCDHKMLVPGVDSAKRGVRLGQVTDVLETSIRVHLHSLAQLPVAGDGIAVLIRGGEEGESKDDSGDDRHVGGRIYDVKIVSGSSARTGDGGQECWIEFGRDDVHSGRVRVDRIRPTMSVWLTDDPRLNRRLRKTYEGRPQRTRDIEIRVDAFSGRPLRMAALLQDQTLLQHAPAPLEVARNRPSDESSIRDKVQRMGGTGYRLGQLTVNLIGQPMVPASLLNQMRRDLLQRVIDVHRTPPVRRHQPAAVRMLQTEDQSLHPAIKPGESVPSRLHVMCRNMQQLEHTLSAIVAGRAAAGHPRVSTQTTT
ncbi:MAG: U32 family peptidase, partial [Planctomycetota bacterium]